MDILNRRESLSMDQWKCVHLPRSRVLMESYRSFLAMLHADNRVAYDPNTTYPIYCSVANGGGLWFLFSPPAAVRFKRIINFWSGKPLKAAPDLKNSRRIL